MLSQGSQSGLDTGIIWEALDPNTHVTRSIKSTWDGARCEARVETLGSLSTDLSDTLPGKGTKKRKDFKGSLFPPCLILELPRTIKQPVDVQPILTSSDCIGLGLGYFLRAPRALCPGLRVTWLILYEPSLALGLQRN